MKLFKFLFVVMALLSAIPCFGRRVHLDGAAFGKVIEGMDVVNKIADTPTDYSDRPLEDQVMESVTVDTFGEAYPEPNKLDR